ncbi:MAG: amidohydrolase, partial [Terriglobales bacterium]
TGVLKESATELVRRVIPEPTRKEKLAALRAGMRLANQRGLTSVLNATGSVEEMELYAELARRGELTVRTTTALRLAPELTPDLLKTYEDARKRFQGPWVRAGVIKAFADGVIESHTAAMLKPYADDPSQSGSTNYSPEQFRSLVGELDRRGFQVITHAIGDRGIRMVLDAYEAVFKASPPRDRRFRIEHIENIDPADVPRLGKLGVIASMQPYHYYPESNLIEVWARNVGPQRVPHSWPTRDLAAGGARLAFGSDWPVVSLDPFIGIQNAITRQQANGEPEGGWVGEQRVTLQQALAAYTRDAAFAQFEEKIKGSLEPGKLADVVVLSQNLFEVPPLAIRQTRVLLTIVGGRIVHHEGL